MALVDKFTQEILNLKSEVATLKAHHIKSASTIGTKEFPLTLDFTIRYATGLFWSDRWLIHTGLKAGSGFALTACYMDEDYSGRVWSVKRIVKIDQDDPANNEICFYLQIAYSTNPADRTTTGNHVNVKWKVITTAPANVRAEREA